MSKNLNLPLEGLEDAAALADVAAQAAAKLGVADEAKMRRVGRLTRAARGAVKVGKGAAAAGAGVSAATGLSVAATSAAGITTGLAHAGAIVGGGMAAGPAVLAGAPAYLGASAINRLAFA